MLCLSVILFYRELIGADTKLIPFPQLPRIETPQIKYVYLFKLNIPKRCATMSCNEWPYTHPHNRHPIRVSKRCRKGYQFSPTLKSNDDERLVENLLFCSRYPCSIIDPHPNLLCPLLTVDIINIWAHTDNIESYSRTSILIPRKVIVQHDKWPRFRNIEIWYVTNIKPCPLL